MVMTRRAALGVMASGLSLAAGCRRQMDRRTSIRWVVDPNPIRSEQIELFARSNDDVAVVMDPDAGPQRVLTQLAGGVPPDIFAIYSPQSAALFAKKDVLEDLRGWLPRSQVRMDTFWPQLGEYIYERGDRANGRILGFPDNCGPYVLYYNRRMFERAGVDEPTGSWSWEEFTDAARRLTVRDGSGRTTQFGMVLPPTYLTEMLVWQAGGAWYSEDGRACLLDSPEAAEAFEWFASLRQRHKVAPSPSEEQSLAQLGGWGGAQNLFKESRAAMIITGRWMIIEWRKKGKELEWDVAPIPHGRVRKGMLESKIYAIPRSSVHKAEAFRFLEHLVGPADEALVADYGDGIPSVASFCRTPAFALNPAYPLERRNQLYLDEMQYCRLKQQSAWIHQLDADTIRDVECDRIWQSEVTPTQAARNIAQRVNDIIQRNLANPNLMD